MPPCHGGGRRFKVDLVVIVTCLDSSVGRANGIGVLENGWLGCLDGSLTGVFVF